MMMDDGYGEGELRGQVLIEALQFVVNSDSDARQAVDGAELDDTCAAELADAITTAVLDDDISDMEGDKLGGVQLYDPGRLTSVVEEKTAEIVGLWASEGKIKAKDAKSSRYIVDTYANQGRRSQMEDKHVVFPDLNALLGIKDKPPQAFFAVYDGHGGVEAAKFAQAQLHVAVANAKSFAEDPSAALTEGFLATDAAFLEKAARDGLISGATACATLIRGNKLYVSWLGDSQVMMCRDGQPVELMTPHKPEREDEKARIEAAEGVVVWFGAWRVNGVLSVARAIGDTKLKQWVIGKPDVAEFDIGNGEEFLVLACDGLWDCMDDKQVASFLSSWSKEHEGMQGVAQGLVEHCIQDLAASDNISVIVVKIQSVE